MNTCCANHPQSVSPELGGDGQHLTVSNSSPPSPAASLGYLSSSCPLTTEGQCERTGEGGVMKVGTTVTRYPSRGTDGLEN